MTKNIKYTFRNMHYIFIITICIVNLIIMTKNNFLLPSYYYNNDTRFIWIFMVFCLNLLFYIGKIDKTHKYTRLKKFLG